MKNKLIVGSLALLTIATASIAFAQGKDMGKGNVGGGNKETGMTQMVNIGPNGNAQLRGTLVSVSGNTLTVASWGGNWTVDATNAKVIGVGLSQYQTGNWITVSGTAGSGAWSVTAKQVRDDSLKVKQASASGTISNLSGQSFTLSAKNGKTTNVSINADAKVWVGGATSTAGGLSNGLFAQVGGVWNTAQDTIFASTVRARTMSTSTKPMEGNSTSTRRGGR